MMPIGLFPAAGRAADPVSGGLPPIFALEPTAPPKAPALSGELVKRLEERQQELDRREEAIRRDEERLRVIRQDIEALLKKQPKPESAGQKPGPNLSQAFEAMPSEEAAQRIERMNEAVALDLLSRMKSKTAGQILAALSPAKAARLVEKLANGRPRASGSTGSSEGQPDKK